MPLDPNVIKIALRSIQQRGPNARFPFELKFELKMQYLKITC